MQQYVNTPTDLLSNEQLSQLMQYFNDQYRVGTPKNLAMLHLI